LTRGVGGVGLASFLSDSGHEMVTAVLPSFITHTVGGSAGALGLIEGVSDGLAGAVAGRRPVVGRLRFVGGRRPRLDVGLAWRRLRRGGGLDGPERCHDGSRDATVSRFARGVACGPLTGQALVLAAAALTSSLVGATHLDAPAPAKQQAAQHTVPVARACGVSTPYSRAFSEAAHKTGFPVSLLVAVAWQESRMDPRARSGAGARGLLQLMPRTARALGATADDPRTNIGAGARYLSEMLNRFGGNLELALAAYNAGPTAVARAGRAPTLATLRYAKNVEVRAVKLASC